MRRTKSSTGGFSLREVLFPAQTTNGVLTFYAADRVTARRILAGSTLIELADIERSAVCSPKT